MACAGYLCKECGGVGEIVHYKIPLTEANMHNPKISIANENLQLFCRSRHKRIHDELEGKGLRIKFDNDRNKEPIKIFQKISNKMTFALLFISRRFFMNQKLEDEINEVVRLITIDKKLGKSIIAKEEADFVKALADKKRYPRAEYVLARMYLCGNQIEQNKTLCMKYLARSSRHASYDIQLKIAFVYHVMGEYKKIAKCLERGLKDCIWL